MKWGHDQLQNDLAAHLSAVSDRMVWTNMQLGPSGSPRPDVYTAPKSYTNFRPVAYEIKISVSDFRSDVTSGKWQSYLKFATGVTFAVPAGLITKADLPKGCGLIVRDENGWRTLKAPTLHPLHEFPREAMIKLLIDGIGRAKHPLPQSRLANQWLVQDAVRKKYGQEIAEALSRRDQAAASFDYECSRHIESLERERKRHDKKLADMRDELQREAAMVDRERAKLCEALGLKTDANIWEIQNAASRALSCLNKDEEIKRLKRAADNISHHLKHAAKAIEQELPVLLTNDATNEEAIEG